MTAPGRVGPFLAVWSRRLGVNELLGVLWPVDPRNLRVHRKGGRGGETNPRGPAVFHMDGTFLYRTRERALRLHRDSVPS